MRGRPLLKNLLVVPQRGVGLARLLSVASAVGLSLRWNHMCWSIRPGGMVSPAFEPGFESRLGCLILCITDRLLSEPFPHLLNEDTTEVMGLYMSIANLCFFG